MFELVGDVGTNEDEAFIFNRLSKGETDHYNSEVDESSQESIEEIKEVIQIHEDEIEEVK